MLKYILKYASEPLSCLFNRLILRYIIMTKEPSIFVFACRHLPVVVNGSRTC